VGPGGLEPPTNGL